MEALLTEYEHPITKDTSFTPLRSDEPLKREINNFLYDKEQYVTLDDGIRALDIALKILSWVYILLLDI